MSAKELTRTELVSVSSIIGNYHGVAPKGRGLPQQLNWLAQNDLPGYFFDPEGGANGVCFITKEQLDVILANGGAKYERSRSLVEGTPTDRPTATEVRSTPGVSEARFAELQAALEKWKSGVEEMILDEVARVDSLHKAVDEVTRVYAALRAEVEPQAASRLPEPPALPAKYRWKVNVVAGGNHQLVHQMRDKIERNFREIRFKFFVVENHEGISGVPGADCTILMTSALSHKVTEALDRRSIPYHRVSGAYSSLEAFLALWTAERRKEQGV